jgi:hypothetical protein
MSLLSPVPCDEFSLPCVCNNDSKIQITCFLVPCNCGVRVPSMERKESNSFLVIRPTLVDLTVLSADLHCNSAEQSRSTDESSADSNIFTGLCELAAIAAQEEYLDPDILKSCICHSLY